MTRAELIGVLRGLEATTARLQDREKVIHELRVHQEEIEAQRDELVRMQRLLEESRDRYADLYDHAPIPYVTLDPNGLMVGINLTGADFFARPRSSLVGRPFVLLVAPENRREFLGLLRRCRRGETALIMETELEVGGRRVPVQLHIRTIGRQSHEVTFRMAIVDVSARRAAEEARAKAEEDQHRFAREEARLRAVNDAKDQFIATLSHELRTPLNPVVTAVSLLERRADIPPPARETLAMMRRNLNLEARLVGDLLDLTRIVQGKLQLRREVVDLHEALPEALETCADDRHPGVEVETDFRAAAHHVRGDATRLRQVFWNLVRNALQHTASGRVRVSTVDVRPDAVLVSVEDTGAGMEPDDLAHVFEPFRQGRSGNRTSGLGLGLAICRSLVEAHGGEITAASAGPGRGARFDVTLSTTSAVESLPHPNSGRPQRFPSPGAGASILLVEDHADSANALAEALGLEGFRVVVAGSLAEAREKLAAEPFTLVISDLGLPDGSGLEMFRGIERAAATRAIALSGYGSANDVRRSLEAGFDTHLTKPVDLDTLLAAITELLDRGKRRAAAAAPSTDAIPHDDG